jgi:hypothetical protein
VLAQNAASPMAMTVTVKGSAAYAQPTAVPLQTALLVVTPAWTDIVAKSQVGGREAAGQLLFLSEVAVVLSNRALECATVFAPRRTETPAEFVIVAGRADAYLPAQGYHTTAVGKVIVDTTGSDGSLPLDRFSADATFTTQKPKTSSKENLRGNNGRLVLQRTGGAWSVDVMVRADELTAEGKGPLTMCPVSERQKASAGDPLMAERRLLLAAERFGM